MLTRALETVLGLANILALGGTSCSTGGCTRASTTRGDAEQIHPANWLKISENTLGFLISDDSKWFQMVSECGRHG